MAGKSIPSAKSGEMGSSETGNPASPTKRLKFTQLCLNAGMKAITAGLYILTASVTGLHNFYWLMEIVNGAPLNLVNLTALMGAATLTGAALTLLFRPLAAAKAALIGSLLLWVYYAPSIAISIFTPFSTWQNIRFFISFHDYVPAVDAIVGPILLIASTANSVIFLRAKSFHEKAG